MPSLTRNKVGDSQWNGYKRAVSGAVPRLIGDSTGDFGTGRTWFWLTAPGPIGVISLDRGLEGVIEPFAELKPIYCKEYDFYQGGVEEAFSQSDAIALRDQIIKDFYHLCEHARSVVLDKESTFWKICRYAEFGFAGKDIPKNFDKLNARYEKVMNHPKALTINFGCITDVKEKWVSQNSKSEGETEVAGYNNIHGIVNTCLHHERLGAGKFQVTVGKTRGPAAVDVQDQTFSANINGDGGFDIPTLGQMLYPDSDLSDWE